MKEGIYDDRTKTTYKVRITKYDNRTNNSQGSGVRTSQGLQTRNNSENKKSSTGPEFGGRKTISNETNMDRKRNVVDVHNELNTANNQASLTATNTNTTTATLNTQTNTNTNTNQNFRL